MSLPISLYDAAACRALDASAITGAHIPGLTLMTRAGEAAFDSLRENWPSDRKVTIFCGPGNNGGDGYVLARCAHAAGYDVAVIQLGSTQHMSADAAACHAAMLAVGIIPSTRLPDMAERRLVVDALLGTGLNKPVNAEFGRAIDCINRNKGPTLSIDIPSGINASTGARMGCAVRADVTITFIGLKQGILTGEAPDYCGRVEFYDLGVPAEVYEEVPATARRLEWKLVRKALSPRSRTAHKGDNGHVLVVGGAPGFSGAVQLAATAAARSGAGLVSIGTHPSTAAMSLNSRPELMVHAVRDPSDLAPLLARATVVAVGPGLSQTDWGAALFAFLRQTSVPMVVDADALNLLACDPEYRHDWVLTPHPGEAARLLGIGTQEVNQDRFAAARALQTRYGGTVVLKGAGSILLGDGLPEVLTAGNPGMASGGMGDVLTGIIAAMVGQGLTLHAAARLGSSLHAEAGDLAARDGERGMLASDLIGHLRALLN